MEIQMSQRTGQSGAGVIQAVEERGVEWLRRALHLGDENKPFPWQVELLRSLCRGDEVEALDIPTGLGKTATMAIWLVARALGAELPRRLIYVVDRRAVVDQATECAEELRDWVTKEPAVADALGLQGKALPISTLRGEHVDNREWLEDPSSPAIVVGTVDMVGSRLLFEGYRCSRKLRPYQAALIGVDSLILLDEAHLAPAFEALVRSATQHDAFKPQGPERESVPTSRVISLSATGRVATNPLRLGEADRQHEVVGRRLNAKKSVRVASPVEADALAPALAQRAWELAEEGQRAARILVFADSRRVAQEVTEALEKLAKGDGARPKLDVETELFVGGRRVAEREQAAKKLAELGFIAGSEKSAEKPTFLVATSAGEVGVDLDADHAVLDLVEWERIVQRLGRVNRRGAGEAKVWVVPPALDAKTKEALEKDEKYRGAGGQAEEFAEDVDDEDEEEEKEEKEEKAGKKLKPEERERVARWRRREASLRAISRLPLSDGAHDASPGALLGLRDKEPSLIEAASTPAPLYPELSRAVVEAWSMTSLEEHTGRPRIVPWLRGWVDEEPQTAVVWRALLPRKADAKAFFEAAPVETAEVLETESVLLLDWLSKRVKQVSKAAEKSAAASEEANEPDDGLEEAERDDADRGEKVDKPRPRLAKDDVVLFVLGDRPQAWTLGELTALDKRGRDDLFSDIAGETIVVDVRLGGLSDSGLLDAKSDQATDVGESGLASLPFRVREAETPEPSDESDGWRREASFVLRENEEGEPRSWLVVETDPAQQSTTADGRSTGREQSLVEHQAFVERHARALAQRLGLSPQQAELLALAAVLHDEGKRAERWQRAFRVDVQKRPLAKSKRQPVQAILAGYRHEFGSLLYAERDPRLQVLSAEDRDLVLHLIAAHHGFARPILRTDGCDELPPSALVDRARAVALRFARLEKRWGPWGLAWWETLLRAADQAASRENDEKGAGRG
jgi:CRISPR-associated endonuclease/helicase Cas3